METQKRYAHLVLIVDRSGSMESICSDMEGGIASLIGEQAKTFDGEMEVTIAQFDDHYDVVADRSPISNLKRYELVPRGGTALLDAIGRTLASTREKRHDGELTSIVVVTDGYENSSREWSRLQVMDSIKQRQAEGWNFTFLGSDQDAIAEGGGLGFNEGDSLSFDGDAEGTAYAMAATSGKLAHFLQGDPAPVFSEADRRRASKKR